MTSRLARWRSILMAILVVVAGMVFLASPSGATGNNDPEPCVPSEGTDDSYTEWTQTGYTAVQHGGDPAPPGPDTDVKEYRGPYTWTHTLAEAYDEIVSPAVPAVDGIWANFSPNDAQATFIGPAIWSSDPRGTWNIHGQGVPGGHAGPDGVYAQGNPDKGGNWFYRQQGVDAVPAVVVHHDAVTETDSKYKIYERTLVPGTDPVECPPVDDECDPGYNSFNAQDDCETPPEYPYEVDVCWTMSHSDGIENTYQWPQTRGCDVVPACEQIVEFQYDTYWIRDLADQEYLAGLQGLNSPADDARLEPHGYYSKVVRGAAECPEPELEVCHPTNGNGNDGWVVIGPDQASSHIDEDIYPADGYWKHEAKDGRHDVYVDENGECPGNEDEADASFTKNFSQATCQSGEILSWGGENVTFNRTDSPLTGPENAVLVTATPEPGSVWADPPNDSATRTVFQGNLFGPITTGSQYCPKTPVEVPGDQVPTAPDCDTDGSYSLPSDTDQVDWSIEPAYAGPGEYTVTASLKNPGTHTWSDDTSGDKTWDIEVLAATGDCPETPECPNGDLNGPNFPGCDRPEPPAPSTRQVPGSVEGCELREVGGVLSWVDEFSTTYVWNDVSGWTAVVTGPVRISETFTPYTDDQYFAECAPVQPPAEEREVAGVQTDCDLDGTLYTVSTYTTPYVWNAEDRAWELGEETGPEVTEEFIPFTGDVPEECLEEEPEVKGEQGQVINHVLPDVEVKGEQAGVPTAVDAGLGQIGSESPLGSRRNPLWLLAIGGGVGLMGSAGLRRRATANR